MKVPVMLVTKNPSAACLLVTGIECTRDILNRSAPLEFLKFKDSKNEKQRSFADYISTNIIDVAKLRVMFTGACTNRLILGK